MPTARAHARVCASGARRGRAQATAPGVQVEGGTDDGLVANRRGTFLHLVPGVLTAIRPVLGALSGFAAYRGNGSLATWLYLVGCLTDVVDGLLARALRVASAVGRMLDGKADLAFFLFVGAGLAARGIRGSDLADVPFLVLLVAGFTVTRAWIRLPQLVGKVVSSVYWLVMFALLWVTVPEPDRTALLTSGLALGVVTCGYEGSVMWRQLKGAPHGPIAEAKETM